MKNNASDLNAQAEIHFITKSDRRYPVKAAFWRASGCEYVITMASDLWNKFPLSANRPVWLLYGACRS